MKTPPQTQESLEKTWWWRLGEGKTTLAFNYELVRRVLSKARLAPYPALKAPYVILITPLSDDPKHEMASRDAGDPEPQREKGWTTPKPFLQWNLNLSDRALKQAFLEFIRGERELQGILRPQKNAGKRNRPLSWEWLELWDVADCGIRMLNDAERKKVSDARKRARGKAVVFRQIVERLRKEKEASPFSQSSFLQWLRMFDEFTPVKLWRNAWPRE